MSLGTRQVSLNDQAPFGRTFDIQGSSGVVAKIDERGNLFLRENLTGRLASISPTDRSFIIQNSTAQAVATINASGSFLITGTLTEGIDPPTTRKALEIRDTGNSIVARIDENGEVYLKGVMVEYVEFV
jgi:hypothetical protein